MNRCSAMPGRAGGGFSGLMADGGWLIAAAVGRMQSLDTPVVGHYATSLAQMSRLLT